ncbi:MAG: methyltransferase domain-containing protein [Candidatus Riflebacteria bacterium]|nr:methyltransferase domain-containing protein [Candidatus Riflebacteria bacterium]
MSFLQLYNELKTMAQRSAEKEFMDNPEFQGEDLIESFRFIKLVNQFGGGRMAVLNCMKKALKNIPPEKPISVLDVGCGIGDMAATVISWGRANGRKIRYYGLERSPYIIDEARRLQHCENITFIQGDLFDADIPEVDLTMISMVLHHFDDTDVVAAIKHLTARSRIALLINDLERSKASYLICKLLAVGMRNPQSRYDALLSIRKGFTVEEMQKLIQQAGCSASLRSGLGWRILGVIPMKSK